MAEIMTETALVFAKLSEVAITNDDPMRQTKRELKAAAEAALREGVRQANALLNCIEQTGWDFERATKEGDTHAD